LTGGNSTTLAQNRRRVGFGTAGLGSGGYRAVRWALEAGFRSLDTAEEDEHWYDPEAVGRAARDHFDEIYQKVQQQQQQREGEEDEEDEGSSPTCPGAGAGGSDGPRSSCLSVNKERVRSMIDLCSRERLRVSTKIPPWALTGQADVRRRARDSRRLLVGFCDDPEQDEFPLDAYYLHAPECWRGWHPRCDDPPPNLLTLREAWAALEAVAGPDGSARRIGLSNVRVDELLDVVRFVRERQEQQEQDQRRAGADGGGGAAAAAPPRIPDVVQAYSDPIEPADELREACDELGIEFVSYSTLGTQHRYRRNREGELENPVLSSPVVAAVAARRGRSPAEVVLAWALARNMSVIPRSGNREHVRELARLLEDPDFLDAEDLGEIDAMKHTL
jgi:diketogulonate reductase-like aldo/keto reductase